MHFRAERASEESRPADGGGPHLLREGEPEDFPSLYYSARPLCHCLFVHLLGQIIVEADLLDHVKLRFQPVHVMLLVDQDLLEQLP
jgi:hypothetical protein